MDPKFVPLYYLSSLAGLIMVAGGVWLLYKQKIYIDKESNQVTEIETPLGKFKTNIPALVLFALGFVPLIYPIVQSSGFAEEVRIVGNVKASTFPVQVYAVIKSDSLLENRDFSLPVPVPKGGSEEYKIIYVAGNIILEDRVDLTKKQNEELHLQAKEIFPAAVKSYQPAISPKPAGF
jgi:hypothetical protein